MGGACFDDTFSVIRAKTHKLIYDYGCNYDGGYQTPAGWELYDLINDPHETRNLYNAPDQTSVVDHLRRQLADLRKHVGDDATHFPACEKIVQEFWDYDAADRARAIDISHQYLQRRLKELKAGQRNVQTY